MSEPPVKQPKSLFRKLLKIGLIGLLLLLLIVVGLAIYGVMYIGSDKVKTFDDVAFLGGGSISVGGISVSDVWDYPEIELTVRSLHVWDVERTSVDSSFFAMDEGRIKLRADLLNSDTILLREVAYKGGRFHLIKDDQGQDAIQRIRGGKPASKSVSKKEPRFQVVLSPDLIAGIENLDFRVGNPKLGKDYAGLISRLDVFDLSLGENKRAKVDFDVNMKGLTFKASEGPFVKDARLQGGLDFKQVGSKLIALIPNLKAGVTNIDFAATIFPKDDSVSVLKFDVPSADLRDIRPLLAPGLQEKLVKYNIEGPFPATLNLFRINEPGTKPEVHVDLQLNGNKANVDGIYFDEVFLKAEFINRIPKHLGDFNPSAMGSIFSVDTVITTCFGFDLKTIGAQITSYRGKGAFIDANLIANGSAKAMSELLKSDQFLFTQGEVALTAVLKGPLSDPNELLGKSNGRLHLSNPSIKLMKEGVQLPLSHLTLEKQGDDATVDLKGYTLSAKHPFHVSGSVHGVSGIVGGANADGVSSTIKIESKHLSWSDFAAYLGTKSAHEPSGPVVVDTSIHQAESLKAVLRSVASSFQPTLEIAIDTLSYLDVSLNSFHTGVHFVGGDTVVLERTTFLLDTAEVGFGGSLAIGSKHKTPFDFSLSAAHINVEKLLPKLNYLNSDLLRDMATLPDDVDIEIEQSGYIDDRKGLLTNTSSGFIDLVSNKHVDFRAHVDFEPDQIDDLDHKSTHVAFEGHAVLFNDFFQTEDFLFKDGDFDFTMAYSGIVPDVETLVQNEEMTLDFRNGCVLFRSAGLELPVESLKLNMHRDTANVEFSLNKTDIGQKIKLTGVVNNLSEVVLGESGKQFSTKAVVESERLVWNDLDALIGRFAGEKEVASDTVDLHLRETVHAVMSKFNPDIHIRIGELEINDKCTILEVESGILMDDQQRMFVDTTGFVYEDGSMQFSGSVGLDDLTLTPFNLDVNTDDLNVGAILYAFDYFGIPSLKETEILEGKMSLDLNLQGDIQGESGRFNYETAKGVMSFSFYDLEVEGLQQIDEIARKIRMTRRLEDLKFATLTNVITLDTNIIHLPLMEIPTSAFRVFVAGDMEIGEEADVWVTVPLANISAPDTLEGLEPAGYASDLLKLHLEFITADSEKALKTKLRLSRKKYHKRRKDLEEWRAAKKKLRQDARNDKRSEN